MFPLAPPPFPPPSCSEDIAVWKLSSRKFPCGEEGRGGVGGRIRVGVEMDGKIRKEREGEEWSREMTEMNKD